MLAQGPIPLAAAAAAWRECLTGGQTEFLGDPQVFPLALALLQSAHRAPLETLGDRSPIHRRQQQSQVFCPKAFVHDGWQSALRKWQAEGYLCHPSLYQSICGNFRSSNGEKHHPSSTLDSGGLACLWAARSQPGIFVTRALLGSQVAEAPLLAKQSRNGTLAVVRRGRHSSSSPTYDLPSEEGRCRAFLSCTSSKRRPF